MRYSYTRLHVLPRRAGWDINHTRIHRLYVKEGRSIRARTLRGRHACRYRSGRTRPAERMTSGVMQISWTLMARLGLYAVFCFASEKPAFPSTFGVVPLDVCIRLPLRFTDLKIAMEPTRQRRIASMTLRSETASSPPRKIESLERLEPANRPGPSPAVQRSEIPRRLLLTRPAGPPAIGGALGSRTAALAAAAACSARLARKQIKHGSSLLLLLVWRAKLRSKTLSPFSILSSEPEC